MLDAKHVWFNGGAGREKEYALVAAEKGDTKLDLVVLTASGNQLVEDIPRREPSDYGPEGGGDTWHIG